MAAPLVTFTCTLTADCTEFMIWPTWHTPYKDLTFELVYKRHRLVLLFDTTFNGLCRFEALCGATYEIYLCVRPQTENFNTGERNTTPLTLPIEAKPYFDFLVRAYNMSGGSTREAKALLCDGELVLPTRSKE